MAIVFGSAEARKILEGDRALAAREFGRDGWREDGDELGDGDTRPSRPSKEEFAEIEAAVEFSFTPEGQARMREFVERSRRVRERLEGI